MNPCSSGWNGMHKSMSDNWFPKQDTQTSSLLSWWDTFQPFSFDGSLMYVIYNGGWQCNKTNHYTIVTSGMLQSIQSIFVLEITEVCSVTFSDSESNVVPVWGSSAETCNKIKINCNHGIKTDF